MISEQNMVSERIHHLINTMISIVPVSPEYVHVWKSFRDQLFGEVEPEITDFDIKRITEEPDQQCFIALDGETPVGFAEVALRNLVDGCRTSPVAYLEGIFVAQQCRGKGVGRQLLLRCEQWGVSMGCSEFACDSEIDKEDAQRFHRHMGFTETSRIVQFRNSIEEQGEDIR